MATERIYYAHPHQNDFEARVIEVGDNAGRPAVVLDRTAFYPTGGGQPHDTGLLGDARVVDVVEDDQGRVLHVLEGSPPFSRGDTVLGRVDAARRLDHLQQHSGQHLLSAAFERVAGAPTLSFHLGVETSTIDLALQEDGERVIAQAVELADRVIVEDRPMTARIVDQEEAQRLALRKEVPVAGDVRVVSIGDFDRTPCGGTHALRTGEIRMIAVLGRERHKKGTRVEFIAGNRVLRRLLSATTEAEEVGRLISAPRGERVPALRALLEERKQDARRLRALTERAAGLEADVLAGAVPAGRPIRRVFDDRSAEEVSALVRALVDRHRLAFLGVVEPGAGKLVVGSPGPLHAGELLRRVIPRFGGRGGGGPRFAQAGGLPVDQLEETLAALEDEV